MAKKHKPAGVSRAFMVMEATSYMGGGFPAYMNMIMADMKLAMQNDDCYGPYEWAFAGGDGYSVPITIHCTTC